MSQKQVDAAIIEVGTSESGATVLLIPVNEETFLVIADDCSEQDTPYSTSAAAHKAFKAKLALWAEADGDIDAADS